jgi:hypothetical protein
MSLFFGFSGGHKSRPYKAFNVEPGTVVVFADCSLPAANGCLLAFNMERGTWNCFLFLLLTSPFPPLSPAFGINYKYYENNTV